jgi:hypothetical protein
MGVLPEYQIRPDQTSEDNSFILMNKRLIVRILISLTLFTKDNLA